MGNKKLITILLCTLIIVSNFAFSQTIVKAVGVADIGWKQSGATWNYLNSNGVKTIGWVQTGGKWYYLNSNGDMVKAWFQSGGTWYYLNPSGAMETGWTNAGGTWFYLNSSGAMVTAWIQTGGTWYYLNPNGDMAKGWLHIGSTWYYLNPSGVMQTGWTKVGGTWYYLNSSGVMATGWLEINGMRYYLNASGATALNTTIEGVHLGSDGAMEVKEPISVSINKTEVSLQVGGTYNLIANLFPINAINKAVTWISSDNNIVGVDNTGKITAVGLGTAKITVITAGLGYKATCNVTVKEKAILTFAIDIGHNSAHDGGASGIRSEDACTKEVGTKVMEKLTNLGYGVIDCSPTNPTSTTDSLQQRCDAANVAEADYYAAIHFNIFNGAASGSEVYIGSDEIKIKAQQVLNNLASLGYINRGVKDNSRRLYVLSNTNMPAMLIECSFLDSTSDMGRYNPDTIADAIVNGLLADN